MSKDSADDSLRRKGPIARLQMVILFGLLSFRVFGIEAVPEGYFYSDKEHKAVMNVLNENEILKAQVLDSEAKFNSLKQAYVDLEEENEELRVREDLIMNWVIAEGAMLIVTLLALVGSLIL